VEVTELREGTFYAELVLRRDDDRVVRVSSRPSDAIALAARLGTPIYAAEPVLDEAGVVVSEEDEQEEVVEQFREFLQNVNPEDFAS
jgi:bifunctional DNase/RNase